MLGNLFNALFYDPLYNLLVLFVDILPTADVGLAIIILTLLVKVALLPLSVKSTRTQIKMKAIEPKLKEIQTKYKDNREMQATEMMSLYREAKVNPFSGILLMLIQFPIIIALYIVFARGGLPEIDPTRLYSFIPEPETVNVMFLGLVNIVGKSLPIAIIAGITQFFQSHVLLSSQKEVKEEAVEAGKAKEKVPEKNGPSFSEELQKSLKLQMRFVFPIIIGVISYTISAAVGLYFIVSALFAIVQEVLVKRRIVENYEKQP